MGSCVSSQEFIVRSGECAAVYDDGGTFTAVCGPAKLSTRKKTAELMTEHRATDSEYLTIQHKDGSTEHRQGPCAVFRDPTKHNNISSHDLWTVPEGEQVAVWSPSGDLKLVRGPTRFVPGDDTVEKCLKYIASQTQYLLVITADGKAEVEEGPTEMFQHPIQHKSVEVKSVMYLKDQERVAIQEHDGTRTILDGPKRVLPGTRTVTTIPLRVATDKQYISVRSVDGEETHKQGPVSMHADPLLYSSVDVNDMYSVPSGYRVAVWEKNGAVALVDGPTSFMPMGRQIHECECHTASATEYIKVEHSDGSTEHIPGPAALFQDPVKHEKVSVENAINLNSGEVLVVYKQSRRKMVDDDSVGDLLELDQPPSSGGRNIGADQLGDATRRLVYGPTLFVPTAEEWLHEFAWHGKDPLDAAKKVPGGLRFQKLRLVPDQFYYNVNDVRTADDALVMCKVMVFFELMDLNKMLDATVDPIGDFINALSADIVSFATVLPYELFIEKTAALNSLESYPNLTERAAKIGYTITKVVYRGYEASNQLQMMHNAAIEQRTQLRLNGETEEKKQDLEDLKLQKDVERSVRRQELEQQEVEHSNLLARKKNDEQQHALQKKNEMEISHLSSKNDAQLRYFRELQGLGLDLTRYMVAKEGVAPNKVIQIGGGNDGKSFQLNQKLVMD